MVEKSETFGPRCVAEAVTPLALKMHLNPWSVTMVAEAAGSTAAAASDARTTRRGDGEPRGRAMKVSEVFVRM